MEIIAIDAGATWVKGGRFSAGLELIQKTRISSGASYGKEEYLRSIQETIEELNSREEYVVSLGLPGMFSKDGQHVLYLPNVQRLGVETKGLAVSEIQQHLGVEKLTAANDAKCAALAEWARGWGQADPHIRLLHITWGTGIGTGLIEGGAPAYGWEGGHIPFEHESELEMRIGVSRLAAQAKVTPQRLRAAAVAGNPAAEAILTEAVHWLTRALRTMAVIGYPDVVTIGGAFANQWLVEQLRSVIAHSNNKFISRALTADMIQLARLGNDAGILGAALLAREKFKL